MGTILKQLNDFAELNGSNTARTSNQNFTSFHRFQPVYGITTHTAFYLILCLCCWFGLGWIGYGYGLVWFGLMMLLILIIVES